MTHADYDFTPHCFCFDFDSGNTQDSITITAVDDTDDDDGESLRITLSPFPLPAGVTKGAIDESVVNITDNDKPTSLTVNFEQSSYTVAEGRDGHREGHPLR